MSNCKNDSKALEYWRKWAKKKYINAVINKVDSDSDARLRTLIDYEIGWLQDELEIAMDFACKMDAKNQTPERNEVDALKVHHSKLSAKILNVFPPKMTYVNDLQALDVIKREHEQLRAQLTASKELNRQAYCTLDVHCPNEEIVDKLFNFLKEGGEQ